MAKKEDSKPVELTVEQMNEDLLESYLANKDLAEEVEPQVNE